MQTGRDPLRFSGQMRNGLNFVMDSPIPLSKLPPGRTALVHSLPVHSPYLTRLRELGLVPGTPVHVIRRAPFGEPLEISLRGSSFAMRNRDAGSILVTEVAPE